MAKVSAIQKNDKRIKLSDRLFKKRLALKKIIMDKRFLLKRDLKHNKNYLIYLETLPKIE